MDKLEIIIDKSGNKLYRIKDAKPFNLKEYFSKVHQNHGKSLFSQLKDILALCRRNKNITIDEYYYYSLYDDKRFEYIDKKKFIGKALEDKIYRQCNKRGNYLADDKLAYYMYMKYLGLPTPKILAIYHPCRFAGNISALRCALELKEFLRDTNNYPFFLKPIISGGSQGVAGVNDFDSTNNKLILSNDSTMNVDECIERIISSRVGGYLFQELLTAHPLLTEVCGNTISSIRLMILINDKGLKIYKALWKIPTGSNMADNFWRKGNLLATININNGQVDRIVRGVGIENEEITIHSDTSASLKGFIIPYWKKLIEMCKLSAFAFPDLRIQSWDVAITPDGPVLLELNSQGAFNLPQIGYRTGIMDKEFQSFLESCGVTI